MKSTIIEVEPTCPAVIAPTFLKASVSLTLFSKKSNGSSNTGNAGNNDIAPPIDIETAQKRFDQLDKKQLPSLEEVAEKFEAAASPCTLIATVIGVFI
jgi:hypothetical protein